MTVLVEVSMVAQRSRSSLMVAQRSRSSLILLLLDYKIEI